MSDELHKAPGALLESIRGIISEEPHESPALQLEGSFLEKDLDRELKIEDVKTRKEFNQLLRQNREERKKYAHHIFILTCIWTTLIVLIIAANGLKSINNTKYFDFEVSDKVLITLITSTTINFFGFFLLVVKYLFNTHEKDKKGNEKLRQPKREIPKLNIKTF